MIQTTLFGTKAKKKEITRDDFFDDPEETAEKKAIRNANIRSTIYFESQSKQFVFKKYEASQVAVGHWRVSLSKDPNAVREVMG
jgi:hypothetical protein